MNALATIIGWIVIISIALNFINKINENEKERKRKINQEIFSIWAIACRIILRQIYNGTTDQCIKDKVKGFTLMNGLDGWAYLELELSDFDFMINHKKYNKYYLFIEAEKAIIKYGHPLKLIDKKIELDKEIESKYFAGLVK